MPSVRCLNCRDEFDDSHDYLVHECQPDPSTEDRIWIDEIEDEDDERLSAAMGEIEAITDRLGELFAELVEIRSEYDALDPDDDDDDDEFFGPDDEDDYPIGYVRGAILGAGLVIGLLWVAVDVAASAVKKALR